MAELTTRITLQFPITSGDGRTISELTLRRLKRKDLAAAAKFSKDEVDQETFLFARATSLTMEDIDELDLADNKVLAERFRALAGNGGDAAELGRGDAAGAAPATQ
ncbi:hypothetical protein D3C76_428100 [compost metagenome]